MRRLCWSTDALAFPIRLEQSGPDVFDVAYGRQIKIKLNYAQAAKELGESIMHALSCDGKVDNSAPRTRRKK